MKYILHLYQGNGCDYTISCGETNREFECDNPMNLREKVKDIVDEYSRDQISSATLYKIAHEEKIDIEGLYAEDDAAEVQKAKDIKELEEKRILAELKAKYPDA